MTTKQTKLTKRRVVDLAVAAWKCRRDRVTVEHRPDAPLALGQDAERARPIAKECRYLSRRLSEAIGADSQLLRCRVRGKTRYAGALDPELVAERAVARLKAIRHAESRTESKPSRERAAAYRDGLLLTAKLTPANVRRAAHRITEKINRLRERAEAINPGSVDLSHMHRWQIGKIETLGGLANFNLIKGSGDTLEDAAREAGLSE